MSDICEKISKKKNIVFILSDDQGAWAMHCAGNDDIITPNLDRLSQMGSRFTNFFCASPVCSPARASIITGEMPSCHGVLDWIGSGNMNTKDYPYMKVHPHFQREDRAIEYLEGHDTYIKHLREAGYRCGLSGKWHLGNSTQPKEGFEKWYTIAAGGCNYFNPDIYDHETGRFYNENRYVTDLITQKALEFLDEYMAGDAPYYLSVHYTAPHDPWYQGQHKEEIWKLYANCEFKATPNEKIYPNQIDCCLVADTPEKRREHLTGYYAAITAMDDGIGQILDKLEENHQLENAIVIFTSDNGMNMGHHGIWGKGNGTYPPNMYDTSVKVPFLIYDSEYFYGGKVIHRMAGHCDLFPTLLDMVGVTYNMHEKQPGRSIKMYAENPELEESDAVVICDEYGKVRMIRTSQFKYVCFYEDAGQQSVSEEDLKKYNIKEQFFDLTMDADEKVNRMSEIAYQQKIVELRQRMEEFFSRYSDEINSGIQYPVTGSGQMKRCHQAEAFDQKFSYYYKTGDYSFGV